MFLMSEKGPTIGEIVDPTEILKSLSVVVGNWLERMAPANTSIEVPTNDNNVLSRQLVKDIDDN